MAQLSLMLRCLGISKSIFCGIGWQTCVRSVSKLSFSVEGEGRNSDAPLVILHGVMGSKMNWRTISKSLSSRLDRPVYALDARNHGQSPWLESMSYSDMSDDVRKFLSDHGISTCCLMGHSMGGKTAMVTALQHQELIDKLIVVDSAPVVSPSVASIASIVNAMTSIELNSPSASTRREVDSLLEKAAPEKGVRDFLLTNLMAGENGLFWRANIIGIERNLPQLASFPNLHSTFTRPTLFIGGRRSGYIGEQERRSIQHFFPRAHIDMLDTGHWVQYENPSGFMDSVASFLTDS